MKIIWKDIFKPRYAVIVEVDSFPAVLSEENTPIHGIVRKHGFKYTPAVKRVPYRRPLSMPFSEFYTKLNRLEVMVVCGSKRTLSRLYGVGSLLPHNMRKAVTLQTN